MQRKAFTPLPWLVAVWVFIVSGCQPEVSTGSVQLVGSLHQALSASEVTRVAVRVTAPDMAPLTTELVKTGGQWGGTLGRVPAGTDRTFSAEAFGADGTTLFQGEATGITIAPGKTALVAITLQEKEARPPFDNAVPVIDSLVASANSAAPGETVTLRATAHDPNAGDSLTYAWTASAGTLGSPSSATTTWTAPKATELVTTEPVTLTLTVTDPYGSTSTTSFALKVKGGSGSADVDVALNMWPQVARIVATPSRVKVGEASTVVATASDADGDALTYQWSASGCTGSWTGSTSATARFTPDAVPPGGSCECRLGVTVKDGRGGQARGTLAMCVGAPTVPLFAPEVVSSFQSDSATPAGGSVTLRVEAEDPQDSALTFSWAASAGTLGTPASSASGSEVTWTAPGCEAGSGGGVSLTATVRNALGLSTSTTFTVRWGATDCLRPGTWNAIGTLSRFRPVHTATLLPSGLVLMVGVAPAVPGGLAEEVFNPETGLSTVVGSTGFHRYGHTATLLPTGKVLVVGQTHTADLFDSVSWTWAPTGSMSTSRQRHTATLLPTGKVLVAGGANSTGAALATAELYDPQLGTWSPTAPMATARVSHTATLLPTGKVLVTGGGVDGTAELYDPETGTWSPTGALSVNRESHAATLLPTGKVLVAGGGYGSPQSTETYDPETGAWSPTGSMRLEDNSLLAATVLPTGKVLVTGYSLAEVYDPGTGRWTPAGAPAIARGRHTATLLPTGKVLVTSAYRVEVFDPVTGAWTSYGGGTPAESGVSATLLLTGKVLRVGGSGFWGDFGTTAELYEPSRGTWSPTGSLSTARTHHTATLLPTGRVLVAGGSSAGGPLAAAELYDPTRGTWRPTGAMRVARSGHFALLLPTGRVLVLGGGSPVMELYDPETGTWSDAGDVPGNRTDFTATLLKTGKVLIAGGQSSEVADSDGRTIHAALYDPATGTWALTGAMAVRVEHTATLLPTGKVLVMGGFGPLGGAIQAYDPTTGTWESMGDMTPNRNQRYTATVLPTGKVLLIGGIANGPVATAELYDPATKSWSPVVDISSWRYGHTATLLPSGQVLVVGNDFDEDLAALLYNP